VVQHGGQIRTIDITQPTPVVQSSTTPFLQLVGATLPSAAVQQPSSNNDERGLLGLAFHPQYQTNGKFYVYYTSQTVTGMPANFNYYQNVVEFIVRDPGSLAVNPNLDVADIASARSVMRIQHPTASTATNHNGGWIGFGPDGYLYISTGDGGNGGDTGTGHNSTIGNAQDTGLPLGKIMRIDVNSVGPAAQGPFWSGTTTLGAANYGIPADNPTLPVVSGGATPARREIWAYGTRNAWRCSFDRLTGDFWIADVGQDAWEEINFQPRLTAANLSQVAGRNYGWRCYEGTSQYNSTLNGGRCPGTYNDPALTAPVGVYPQTAALGMAGAPRMMVEATTGTFWSGGCAITGGYVYRGCKIPELYGRYVFSDYCLGTIYSTTINPATGVLNSPTLHADVYAGSTDVTPNIPAYTGTSNTTVSFGEDAYGELYLVSQSNARIYKFVRTAAGSIPLANPDQDRNGVLSVTDIFTFLGDWFNSSIKGDYNRSGAITVQDIFDFLAAWFGGCAG
jgi:glucose/arabinose dehydrogenase